MPKSERKPQPTLLRFFENHLKEAFMLRVYDFGLKLILYFLIGSFGVGFVDLALQLHNQTAAAYKRGPISATTFTRMMTGRDYRGNSLYVNEKSASKR